MRVFEVLTFVLLVAAFVEAAKRHRKHQKSDLNSDWSSSGPSGEGPGGMVPGAPGGWPGDVGNPGSLPGAPGGDGPIGSGDPEHTDEPSGPGTNIPVGGGYDSAGEPPPPPPPPGAERRSLNRKLRQSMEEARRASKLHPH